MPDKQEISQKLTQARRSIVMKHPFFGTLVMHLKMGLAKVGTAATDMKRIIWDPEFISRLSPEEIEFVMMHEVLHCALKHCMRGRELDQRIFNIACDIVVNSSIMYSIGVNTFTVDGNEVMHLAPDGQEGYRYTAKQVYDMLLAKYATDKNKCKKRLLQSGAASGKGEEEPGELDNHEVWDRVDTENAYLENQWKEHLQEAANKAKDAGMYMASVRELMEEYAGKAKIDWKSVLHDFIQVVHERHDFTFSPYDRRFAESDFLLPAFNETDAEKVSNLWFAVDTSGSISDENLALLLAEIRAAVNQLENLSGRISFFDTEVSDPIEFDGEIRFTDKQIQGGGGTSFSAVFAYMQEHMSDNLPTAVIVLTDGYSKFPPQKAALEVPVLWIIVGSEVKPPWGTTTYVEE